MEYIVAWGGKCYWSSDNQLYVSDNRDSSKLWLCSLSTARGLKNAFPFLIDVDTSVNDRIKRITNARGQSATLFKAIDGTYISID